jgi:hypothetical protein
MGTRALASLTLLLLVAAAPAPRRGELLPVEKKAQALLAEWKGRFDAEKFNYVVAGPFVIAGNGSKDRLARYRDQTILAAARALHATYFEKEPAEPVLILLFESAEPYQRLAKKWFDDDEVPHFGFFRRNKNVMLMNVGTGTGTLVHELVHALIAPDFPRVPDWFNEGLASLYEQCAIAPDNRSITGQANWRLPALKAAVKKGELRSLKELIEDPKFYDPQNVGMNYAQARYLLMYLQEKKLLAEYYARFRDNAREDPTGLKTLEAVAAPQGMEAFEKAWRAWVGKLQYNG